MYEITQQQKKLKRNEKVVLDKSLFCTILKIFTLLINFYKNSCAIYALRIEYKTKVVFLLFVTGPNFRKCFRMFYVKFECGKCLSNRRLAIVGILEKERKTGSRHRLAREF